MILSENRLGAGDRIKRFFHKQKLYFLSLTGFTFVEIMVAVSILSLGTVMVHQSNLSSLDVYGRYVRRLSIQTWADEKIWEAKEAIYGSESPKFGRTSGEVVRRGKRYHWNLDIEDTDMNDIYVIQLDVTWKEGRDQSRLARSGFVQKPELIPSS